MRTGWIASAIAAVACAGFIAGCSASDDSEGKQIASGPQQGEDDLPAGQEAKPFAEFEADGHLIRAYELSPGELVVAERRLPGKPSIFDGLSEDVTLSEFYLDYHEGPVPEAIVEFETRAAKVRSSGPEAAPSDAHTTDMPELASAVPGLKPAHEAGSAHFRSAHCPTQPSPLLSYEGANTPTTPVRQFCWADNHTDSFEEWADARALTHHVASVAGNICYTLWTDEQNSLQFTILHGEQWEFRWRNSVYHDCPPWPFACGVNPKVRLKRMHGMVHCAGGDTWRFGGGFWR